MTAVAPRGRRRHPTGHEVADFFRGSVYHGPVGGLWGFCGTALTEAGARFRAKVHRGGDLYAVDFLCDGGLAVKMSVGHHATAIERLLRLYARGEDVSEILLVTAGVGHAAYLGGRSYVLSKPLHVARFHWCVLT